jgi:hypothetical protein
MALPLCALFPLTETRKINWQMAVGLQRHLNA